MLLKFLIPKGKINRYGFSRYLRHDFYLVIYLQCNLKNKITKNSRYCTIQNMYYREWNGLKLTIGYLIFNFLIVFFSI